MKPKWKKRSEDTTNKHVEYLSGTENDIVLIGTSMFERFQYVPAGQNAWNAHNLNTKNIFNCGVGGDRIENILYRIKDRKVLKYMKNIPSKMIVMCGANDVDGNKPVDLLADGVYQILNCIRERFPDQKRTKLYLIGAYPRKSDKISEENVYKRVLDFNTKIQKLNAKNLDFTYHYFGNDVLDADGKIKKEYFTDIVHFNDKGYDLFAKHLKDIMDDNADNDNEKLKQKGNVV